jgi:hypothetical protein
LPRFEESASGLGSLPPGRGFRPEAAGCQAPKSAAFALITSDEQIRLAERLVALAVDCDRILLTEAAGLREQATKAEETS